MGQLGFFTKVQLAEMRDRTKSRHYSPQADAFRRKHERHRAWGLTQRHARKLRSAPMPPQPEPSPPALAPPIHTPPPTLELTRPAPPATPRPAPLGATP